MILAIRNSYLFNYYLLLIPQSIPILPNTSVDFSRPECFMSGKLYSTCMKILISNYMTCCQIYLGQEGGGNALAERLLRIMLSQQIEQVRRCLLFGLSEPIV